MNVASLMTRNPISIDSCAGVDQAMRLMDEHGVRHLPVTQSGEYIGVVADRDLLQATGWLPRRLREAREGPYAVSKPQLVRDCMHTPAMHAKPGDDILTLSVEAVVQGMGCIPVVDQGRLLGIVTERDMLEAYLRHSTKEAATTARESVQVQDVMSKPARSLQRTACLREAQELCQRWEIRHVPILDGKRLVGILSDRDIRRARGRGRRDEYPLDELMTMHPITVLPNSELPKAAALMVAHRCSALPVLRDDELIGIITVEDLIDPCLRALP